jgi:hypothetical protein
VFAASFPIIFKILTYIPWKNVDWTRSRRIYPGKYPITTFNNTKVCNKSIQEYKANVKPGSRKDSLCTLIASRDDDGSGLSHEELAGNASIFIFAGISA